MRTVSIDLAEWERLCPDGTGVFHRPALLCVLDTHSPADLRTVAGDEGNDLGATLGASLVPYYTVESPRLGGRAVERVVTPRYH